MYSLPGDAQLAGSVRLRRDLAVLNQSQQADSNSPPRLFPLLRLIADELRGVGLLHTLLSHPAANRWRNDPEDFGGPSEQRELALSVQLEQFRAYALSSWLARAQMRTFNLRRLGKLYLMVPEHPLDQVATYAKPGSDRGYRDDFTLGSKLQ
jgi:hypothetical protein